MTDLKERYQRLVGDLRQARDELGLRIHLGTAEAKEEWGKLEQQWEKLAHRGRQMAGAAGESAKGVGSAVELAAEELKKGYERIRQLLK
jgi:hypothetical protein